jgi:N-alpha-acetyl-L-2,4-diaminobutyrate deacetylase
VNDTRRSDDHVTYRCTVDLDAPGRSVGHFSVPWSRDDSGWGNLLTPIAVLANGDGPTVLVTGGNHGDEFEGPLALRSVLHELDVTDLAGRVIAVPGLNQAALKAGRRLSPIDGGNLNRSFPGDPLGTTTERIADFVTRELVARADIVLDIHSGGQSMVFQPAVMTHDLPDPEQAAATAGYMKVFGAPLAVFADEPDPAGMLDTTVESLGKVFLTTEIWGGRSVSARTIGIARRGILNTLRHAGVIDGEPEYEAAPTRLRMVADGTSIATEGGLFQPLIDPGEEVSTGDLLAQIHPLDDLAAPPTALRARVDGVVIMRHDPGLIQPGDPAMTVAVHDPTPW